MQESSLFAYYINYQSTHTNSYQTHYFQTIITTTNISVITFFQSFTHIIHCLYQIQYHNQTLSILCYSYSYITAQRHSFHSCDNSDPQLRHSTLAHFIHFTPHSLSFISHYSTIISSFLFNITEYNHGNIIFIIHYSYHSFLISIYIYTLIPYQFYSYLTIHVNHFQSHKLVSYIK